MTQLTSRSTQPQELDPFIQSWRGVAVLLVVYYHFSNRLPFAALGASTAPLLQQNIGKLGVLIFFVISGYLIAKTLERARSLPDFYAKRLSRIWPLFILASVVIFAFVSVFEPPVVVGGPKQFYTEPRTIVDLLGTVLFLGDLPINWVDGAFWSILVEVKFYLYFGLLRALFRKNYVLIFMVSCLVLSSLDLLILALDARDDIALAGATQFRLVSAGLHGVLITPYLPFFAVGVGMYHGRKDGLLVALIFLAAAFAVLSIYEDHEFVLRNNLVFCTVFSGLLAIDRFFLRGRIIQWVGAYSYAIYLFHQMIGLTLIRATTPAIGIDLSIALALLCVAAIAALGSFAVEWRFRKVVELWLVRALSWFGLGRFTFVQSDQLGKNAARAT